jgi:hypothetical protein
MNDWRAVVFAVCVACAVFFGALAMRAFVRVERVRRLMRAKRCPPTPRPDAAAPALRLLKTDHSKKDDPT